ncbi:MAG: hypothetical protein KY475_16705 [Planctomycetes bacterium]|nr:hypothetical protein [Planctomycetota bacterium]
MVFATLIIPLLLPVNIRGNELEETFEALRISRLRSMIQASECDALLALARRVDVSEDVFRRHGEGYRLLEIKKPKSPFKQEIAINPFMAPKSACAVTIETDGEWATIRTEWYDYRSRLHRVVATSSLVDSTTRIAGRSFTERGVRIVLPNRVQLLVRHGDRKEIVCHIYNGPARARAVISGQISMQLVPVKADDRFPEDLVTILALNGADDAVLDDFRVIDGNEPKSGSLDVSPPDEIFTLSFREGWRDSPFSVQEVWKREYLVAFAQFQEADELGTGADPLEADSKRVDARNQASQEFHSRLLDLQRHYIDLRLASLKHQQQAEGLRETYVEAWERELVRGSLLPQIRRVIHQKVAGQIHQQHP